MCRTAGTTPSPRRVASGTWHCAGLALIVRNARGATLIEAGHALYRKSLAILRQFEDVRTEVNNVCSSLRGTVAIGLPKAAAAVLALSLLRAARDQYL